MTVSVPNNRKLFGKKTAHIDMSIVDLSIAGALIVGPKVDEVRSGSKMPFVHNGENGLAQIRHVRPAQDVPGLSNPAYYGIVFIDIPPSLKDMIFEEMAERRGRNVPELDEIWNHAR